MQVSIDNCKRRFDVDLDEEIKRIKEDMDIKKNGYPIFWGIIKPQFNKKRINKNLVCPMNYLSNIKLAKVRSKDSTIPTSEFLSNIDISKPRRENKKAEELIKKYSIDINKTKYWTDGETFKMTEMKMDELILDLKNIYISGNYIDLMIYLIRCAFEKSEDNELSKIKNVLLKVLYELNPKTFLMCFKKNC